MEYYYDGEQVQVKGINTQIVMIITIISERRPLLFFGILGIISIVVGFILGIRVVNYLKENEVMLTGTALISALLLGVGVFSIFTGIILRTLSRRNGNGNS